MKTTTTALIATLVLVTLPFGARGAGVPIVDKGTATFYVEVTVEGAGTSEFLVDTGSSYSVISESTLTALREQGLATFVERVGGRMADGSHHYVPIYSVSALHIGGACTLDNVKVAVLPGRTRPILGLSALRRAAPFMISMDPPTLELSNCPFTGTPPDTLASGS